MTSTMASRSNKIILGYISLLPNKLLSQLKTDLTKGCRDPLLAILEVST